MNKHGLGLIGCGGRLRSVVQNLINATDEVEVVALHDPNPSSIEKSLEKFNPSATLHNSVEALVNDPRVEWVMIGSWNCQHAEHALAAFKAGKHVFCEKPLALSIEDCLAMRKAWKESGQHFTIGFTLRYSPHYRRIKEILSEGTIGDIISMEFNETLAFNHGGYIHADWRRKTEWAGTHLLEKCCHDIDIVNWMVDSSVSKAASFGGCDFFTLENEHHVDRVGKNDKGKEAFKTWNHSEIEGNILNPFNDDKDILDNQVAIVEFANGVRSTFHTNCNCAIPERRLYICGTEGTLRSDVIDGKIEVKRIGFETELEDMGTDAKGGHGGGDGVLGKSLAQTILKGTPSLTSLDDGLKAAFTAFGIDEAQKTGKVVDLDAMWKKAGL